MTPSKVNQYDIQTTTYKTAGTASAYTLTIPKLTSLVDEFTFVVEFHVENDASATLNINSLGAIAIMTSEGNTVDAGDLKTTGRYTLVYDADTARFVVSETVDSEVESMISGGGLNVGDMFFMEYTSPNNAYSSRQDYYAKYTGGIIGGGGWSWGGTYYIVNGKGAPIMKNGVIRSQYDQKQLAINDSQYYGRLDFLLIQGTTLYAFLKYGGDYADYENEYRIHIWSDIDSATPTLVSGTYDVELNQDRGTFGSYMVGFDGTYMYHWNSKLSIYQTYEMVGTNLTYVGTRTKPVAVPAVSFIQGPYIYYINGNVITKYDIVTGATIDAQYYGTRKWVYNNGVRTNINTTGDMHAIFKAFSN